MNTVYYLLLCSRVKYIFAYDNHPLRAAFGILMIFQLTSKVTALPAILTFEDVCPQSQEDLEKERAKYFRWAETYQNPLSEAYKSIKSVPAARSILFHVALKYNLSLGVIARDPTQSSSEDFIMPGADLKLDTDLSYKLHGKVDMTSPYYYDYITFCFKAPGNKVNADGFIDVFSSGVLLSLWLSAAICTGVIYVLSFSFTARKFELDLLTSVAFILKSFVIEGHYLKQPNPAVQAFASVWSLAAYVTSTIYVSVVVSSVLSPDPPPKMPESLEDIVRLGMKPTTVTYQHMDVINYLDGSQSDTLKKLALNMSHVTYTVSCQDAAVRDVHNACVAKLRGLQSFLESKYIDRNGHPRLLMSKYRSSTIWTGYGLRKNSPFESIISTFIGQAIAAGLADHWTRAYDDERRRWGVGMALGDQCSNQPDLFHLWHVVGKDVNKNNPNKHNPSCYWWNLADYMKIVKENCVKIDNDASGRSSPLDSMLRVEHLLIVFEVMCFLYSLAFVCFIVELVFPRMRRFKQSRLNEQSRLSCVNSVLMVTSLKPVEEIVLSNQLLYRFEW